MANFLMCAGFFYSDLTFISFILLFSVAFIIRMFENLGEESNLVDG